MTDKTDISIESDSPAKDDFIFWRIVGHETLSRPSTYELTVLSKGKKLDSKDILGYAFDVVIHILDQDGNEHKRHCQGHAVRFMRGEYLGERYQEYRIVLRSWFWLLTKRINSRILQEMDVLKIADEVFDDSPISAIKKIDANMTETHNPRCYCVQHQESDYQYLSRLFEDEGIYYWFDVYDTGDALGTMHLSDTSSIAHAPLPLYPSLKYPCPNGTVHGIVHQVCVSQLDSGRYASCDVNYENIKTLLKPEGSTSQSYEFGNFEVFEYPGGYLTSEQADEVLRTRKDELSYRSTDLERSLTHWHGVGVGRSLTINEHNGLIVTCTFVVSRSNYKNLPNTKLPQQPVTAILREALADDAINAHCLDDYVRLIDSTPELCTNEYGTSAFLITTLPVTVPFKPPRLTPRVTMPGPQSAIVVGPEGEELHADKMGRVKVRFHWDRYDVKKKEDSTCWIRVSQPWAGKNWGAYFMPRIGQEVLVNFVNGDPDQPVIVGRLYNNDQPTPPYKPTQSGFRTHSTPDGTSTNFNELRFEDRKDGEQVFIHAERRMDVRIKRNKYETVQGTSNTLIGGRHILTIGKSLDLHVKENQYWRNDYHCEGSVAGDIRLINDGMTSAIIKEELSLSSPKIVLEAKTEISMKVGGNCVVIDASGVSVDGKMVKINSGGYGSDASDVAINEPYDATGADNGEPGYLERLPKGGGRSGRKIRREKACRAHTTPRPGEPEAITAMRQKLATTPEGRHALEVYDRYDVQATFIPGQDSRFDARENTMNIDPNTPGDNSECAFVHEANHAQTCHEGQSLFGRETTTSLDDYLNGMLNEEANSFALEAEYANSQLLNNTPMINPPSYLGDYNEAYEKGFDAAMDQFPDAPGREWADAGKAAGRDAIMDLLKNGGAVSSASKKTYVNIYTEVWTQARTAAGVPLN